MRNIEDIGIYIDDIGVFTDSWEKHLAILTQVLSRLEKMDLQLTKENVNGT